MAEVAGSGLVGESNNPTLMHLLCRNQVGLDISDEKRVLTSVFCITLCSRVDLVMSAPRIRAVEILESMGAREKGPSNTF